MRIIPLYLALLIYTLSMSQAANHSTVSGVEWKSKFPHQVVYQIFTRSFADGNGDGIGDLQGVKNKLPYLKELGIGAIWLTPIFESPTYHKYDIINYYQIDPECGTKEDLKQLVNEAHIMGIKIILDFVPNHTSTQHEWFKEAVKNNPTYKNYYSWSSDTSVWHKEPEHWHWVDDQTKGNEKYYGYFWRGMPDLNYDNPKVREEIIKAAQFWISECDIDGYRLDAASHVYPYADRKKNYAWWTEFSNAMRVQKPDFYIVGEMWGGDTLIAPYLKAGMDAGFNFDLWFNIKSSIAKSNDDVTTKLLATYNRYYNNRATFCDATLLSNHDNPRIMDEVQGDTDKAKLAAAILFTLPYTPYVYYGDELGMFGPKPDEHIREPFLWDATDEAKCNWEPNFHNAETPTLSSQKSNQSSMYNTYQSLIKFRNQDEVLSDGNYECTSLHKDGLMIYVRSKNAKSYLIVHNLQDSSTQLKLNELPHSREFKIVYSTGGRILQPADMLELKPYSSVVISFVKLP